MTTIEKTESLCPICLKRISAEKIVENNNVYLQKECPEHGYFKVLIWRDANLYEEWSRYTQHANKLKNRYNSKKEGCPFDCGLCDDHEGGTCTAVMEITYKCNMKCPICFADSGKETFEADMDDIKEMYQTVLDNGGPCSIQLSGGEPTVRDDLPQIVKLGKSMGFNHIQVNTNGIRIAEDIDYLRSLKDSGTDLIYLQFDGLTDEIYEVTRGIKIIDKKIQAIENCKKVNIGVLLVPTILPNININQLGDIIKFAKNHMPIIKGIHFQPISYFGRYPNESPQDEDRVTLSDIVKGIVEQSNGEIQLKDFVPRKREDSHCAFSSLFMLTMDGKLTAITQFGKEEKEVIKQRIIEYEKSNSEYFSKEANKFTNAHWRINKNDSKINKNSNWSDFKERLKEYTLSITGMPFQDAYNIDIKRLKGCCVHVVGRNNSLIPLCAFHLTSVNGNRLYKNS